MSSDFDSMIDNQDAMVPYEDESSAPITTYTSQDVFSMDDMTPPMLRLGQGLSPEVQEGAAKPGQWLFSGYPPCDVLHIVPLGFAKRRECRDVDGIGLMCTSSDAITGEGEPGGTCAGCPMNVWSGEGKNRRPPQCTFYYSYMVYVHEHDTLAIVNFKKTGLNTARMLNSIVHRKGFGQVAIFLSSKSKSGSRGSYQIPQIAPVSDDIATPIIASAQAFMGE